MFIFSAYFNYRLHFFFLADCRSLPLRVIGKIQQVYYFHEREAAGAKLNTSVSTVNWLFSSIYIYIIMDFAVVYETTGTVLT